MTGRTILQALTSTCIVLVAMSWLFGAATAGALSAILLFGLVPGLVIQQFAQRRIGLSQLLTAVLTSLPISTLCFTLTRMIGLPPTVSAWSMGILFVVFAFAIRPGSNRPWRLRSGERAALALAFGAAVLLIIATRAPGILASWHGFFHAAVTEQILNTGVPPTNPGLAGEALNFYWAFHVFVALIAAASHANPLTAIAVINSMMLALSLLIAYEIARHFLPRMGQQLLCMAALLGAINTGAGFVLAGKLAKNGRIPGDAFSDGTWIDWLSQRAIPGRLWDGRASSLIKEYYDISGMAAGMALLFAHVWIWIGGPRRFGSWFLPLLIVNMLTLTTWYPPLALPAIAHGGIAICIYCWKRRLNWIGGPRALMAGSVTALVALAIVALYFRVITDSTGWGHAGEPFVSARLDMRSILGAVTPFWAIAPLVLIGGVMVAVRHCHLARLHLLLMTLILFAFAAFADLQQNTQYKYVYALSLPLGILAVRGAVAITERIAFVRLHPRLTYAALSLLFIHPALVFAVGAATSKQQTDRSLAIDGRHIVDHSDPARMTCLAWIRDHAPPDAMLILPLIPHERSPSNPGFRVPAITQRAALLVYDTYHSLRFCSHESRAAILTDIFERGDFDAATTALRENPLTLPIYAVIPTSKIANGTPSWSMVFANENWMVLCCDACDRGEK